MSRRANPTAIGLFLIGVIVLVVSGVAVLASATWFQKRSTFVSFFGESINGLEIGAPVKFQGVPIGSVTALHIQIDRSGKTFQVPVQYEVDLRMLETLSGTFVNLADPAVLREQIADGLRVRLQMESIVTGLLYLEVSYDADAKPPELEPRATNWPELPTTPSLMAALGTGAGSVVADVVKVLFRVNSILEEVDMAGINTAVVKTAQSVQRLVETPEIREALVRLPLTAAQVTRTMASVERLALTADSAVGPIAIQAERATTELANTRQVLRTTLEEAQGILSTDSGIGYELQAVLQSLRQAADALQLLTTSLEQNPDILLRGKKPPEKKP
ncbi:MAG: MCE family protein [Gemmatimonadaceae bacterium]|nr:MCE family protein [Gemmatimonadaceae bacterium]